MTQDVKTYQEKLNDFQMSEFQKIQQYVEKLLPNVELSISYGVLTFKYKGKPVIYFGAFKNHTSLFPASDEMVAYVGSGLEAFRSSKGTLQFSEKTPIPDHFMKKIVEFRVSEV